MFNLNLCLFFQIKVLNIDFDKMFKIKKKPGTRIIKIPNLFKKKKISCFFANNFLSLEHAKIKKLLYCKQLN